MRTLLVPLLVIALAPRPCAAEFEGRRLARLVSRDARMLLWVGDRAAFSRRIERTSMARLLHSSTAGRVREAMAIVGAEASLFFSPEALFVIPELLSRGTGEMAVSVDGYVLEGGESRPDVLFLADVSGYEGLVDALASAAATRGQARFDGEVVPNALAVRSVERVREYRGVRIVTASTRWGNLSLAEYDGVILGARNENRIERALERAQARVFGSLAESAQFMETFEQVAPGPGALFGFVNLRQVRSERSLEPIDPIWNALLADEDSFDAVGFSLRGVSGQFRANVFLSSRGRQGGAIARRASPLRSLERIDRSAAVTFAVRATGRHAGAILASMNRQVGGTWSAAKLEDTFVGLLGPAWADQLASRLGGELAIFQTPAPGQYPTLCFLLEAGDQDGVRRWFEQTTEQIGPRPLRAFDAGGRRVYVMELPGNQYISTLAMTVFDGWLAGSTSVPVLRSLVDRMESPRSPLATSEAFLAPMDFLDRTARDPVYAMLHVDTKRIAPIFQLWSLQAHGRTKGHDGEDVGVAAMELVSFWNDPEFIDAARGLAVIAESRSAGLFLEIAGP